VLADSWQVGLGSGATLLTGAGTLPSSPGGRSYQDVQMARGTDAINFVSGLATITTPGLDSIFNSRIALLFPTPPEPVRRVAEQTDLSAAATTVVLGSKPNGLQPGIALHAEFRALIEAGLSPEQALKAAGVNAATTLGLGLRLGRIAPGADADLVLVDGDPLVNIADALKIVGIVRNGRFFSVSGLIERAERAKVDKTVE
jgi:cytosine/adenosine deaminase-related metal-dependent hydrolase